MDAPRPLWLPQKPFSCLGQLVSYLEPDGFLTIWSNLWRTGSEPTV